MYDHDGAEKESIDERYAKDEHSNRRDLNQYDSRKPTAMITRELTWTLKPSHIVNATLTQTEVTCERPLDDAITSRAATRARFRVQSDLYLALSQN